MSGQSQYLMLEYTNDLFDQRLYRKSFPTEIENTDVVPTMETKESSKWNSQGIFCRPTNTTSFCKIHIMSI